jgi:hypothetical protein
MNAATIAAMVMASVMGMARSLHRHHDGEGANQL